MYTRLLQMLQCCSVCSIECCVFSVYISYIPQYLHIYRFTHCRLTLCSPVRLWAECSRENKQLPVYRLQLQLSAIHILDRFNKTRPGWKCYILRHIPDSEPDRIIMSHTTQNLQLMPQFPSASLALALMAAFFRGDFSHALKNRHFKTSTPLL